MILHEILIITNDSHQPYIRPPLSKELWTGLALGDKNDFGTYTDFLGEKRTIFHQKLSVYETEDILNPCPKKKNSRKVRLMTKCTASKLFPEKRVVQLDDGRFVVYKELLIATGGRPKTLPIIRDHPEIHEKVSTFRTVSMNSSYDQGG
jgi:programmed cell death 8 (apoptosis-inducing factor)